MSHLPPVSTDDVLRFWFGELTADDWWRKDTALDRRIADRFGPTLQAAARCELVAWRGSARGRLAEVIVLDQFSRNIHRDTAAAFANDALALALAQEAVARGCDLELSATAAVVECGAALRDFIGRSRDRLRLAQGPQGDISLLHDAPGRLTLRIALVQRQGADHDESAKN